MKNSNLISSTSLGRNVLHRISALRRPCHCEWHCRGIQSDLPFAPRSNLWEERARSRSRTLLQVATALCCLLLTWTCVAQRSPATLPDVQFSTSGLVLVTTTQEDGKIIVGGYFSSVNGVVRNNIARLNANGSVDE